MLTSYSCTRFFFLIFIYRIKKNTAWLSSFFKIIILGFVATSPSEGSLDPNIAAIIRNRKRVKQGAFYKIHLPLGWRPCPTHLSFLGVLRILLDLIYRIHILDLRVEIIWTAKSILKNNQNPLWAFDLCTTRLDVLFIRNSDSKCCIHLHLSISPIC